MNDIANLVIRSETIGVTKSDRELAKLTRTGRTTDKAVTSLNQSFSRMKGAVAGLVGIGTVTLAMRKLITNTSKQQEVTAQLEARLRSTQHAAGLTRDELLSMATALQQVTTFGDETIIQGQQLLLTFTKIGRDVFPQAVETMLDMSQALGQDLKSSAIQLGKALNDPIQGVTALRRVGVQLSSAQEDQIEKFVKTNQIAEAQKIILAELATQMGNSARAARETFGGAIQGLNNAFGDLFELGPQATNETRLAIEQLTAQISDPAFKQSITEITGLLVKGFGAAAGVIANTATELRRLGVIEVDPDSREALKALNEDIATLQKEAESNFLQRDLLMSPMGPGLWTKEEINQRIRELQREREILINNLNVQAEVESSTPGNAPRATPTLAPPVSEAEEDKVSATERRIQALKAEAETIGFSRRETELYKLELEGATKAELDAADAHLRRIESFSQDQELAESIKSSQRNAAEILDEMEEESRQKTERMQSFAEGAARGMQQHFANFLFDPFDQGLDGMLAGFGRTLQQMVAQAASQQLLMAFFGSLSNFGGPLGSIGSAFAGAFDTGGYIPAGKWGIAGEKGPEIINGPANITSREDTNRLLTQPRNFSVGQMVFPGVTSASEAKKSAGAAGQEIHSVLKRAGRYL